MNRYTYRIGGMAINFFLEPPIGINKEEICAPFTCAPQEGIDFVFRISEEPFPEAAEVYYRDKRSVLLKHDGELYRYTGVLDTGREILWRSCIPIGQKKQRIFLVFLREKNIRERKKRFTEKQLLTMAGFEYVLIHHERVILHASLISFRNQGIVFTAPSGTGKSTQADLWKKQFSDVEIINGDRTILSCESGTIVAHGLPFCGTSGIALNRSLPLGAVIILRQGKENRIRRPKPAEAIKALLAECTVDIWDQRGMEIVIKLLKEILIRIPVYIYECLPDVSAADFLKNNMIKEEVLWDEQ